MAYQELDQYNSPNYTPAAQCAQVFGEPRNPTTFTLHHWGDPSWGQTFEGVIAYLCDGNRPSPTSAHFIVEAGRAACIVSPDDVAWHAGNAHGNATSIGIECNPAERDADYETIAELIAHLRTIYGDLPLVPHNHWTQTDCPGTYDLARIDALARGAIQPAANPTPTPVPEEDIVATLADLKAALLDPEVLDAIARTVATRPVPHYDPATGQDDGKGTTLAAVLGNRDLQDVATRNTILEAKAEIESRLAASGSGASPAAVADELARRLQA